MLLLRYPRQCLSSETFSDNKRCEILSSILRYLRQAVQSLGQCMTIDHLCYLDSMRRKPLNWLSLGSLEPTKLTRGRCLSIPCILGYSTSVGNSPCQGVLATNLFCAQLLGTSCTLPCSILSRRLSDSCCYTHFTCMKTKVQKDNCPSVMKLISDRYEIQALASDFSAHALSFLSFAVYINNLSFKQNMDATGMSKLILEFQISCLFLGPDSACLGIDFLRHRSHPVFFFASSFYSLFLLLHGSKIANICR